METSNAEDGWPAWAFESPLLSEYYATEWGMPVRDEQGLFERLALEIFQAGLSWRTVLQKRAAFRQHFAGFDVDTVASFGDVKVASMLGDAGIIRHEGKIRAVIHNASRVQALRDTGGFEAFIWSFQPERTPMPRTMAEVPTRSKESEAMAVALKAQGFRFVGPTMLFAMMEAIGMVDTHLLGSTRRGSSGLWAADGTRLT